MDQPARRLILHVLPNDQARGAQALARIIADQLDGRPDRHEALTLFAAPDGLLRPEHRLAVAPDAWQVSGVAPRAAWRLWRSLRDLRPDVVVSHGGEMLKYLPLVLSRRVPIVYYRVGTANEHLQSRWRRCAYTRLVRRCALVVAISDDTAAETVELFGGSIDDIVIIPNARDPKRFRRLPRAEVGTEAVALFVGDVSQGKGADRFVRAVGALRAEGQAVRGVLAGSGPIAEGLRADAAASGVEMVGHVSDVPALMSACDLFVFPSVDREGMPGVLVEAAMCELPCVASRVPGVPAVVDDGETGFIIEPGDDGALLDRLRDLVVDADRRAQMGAQARRRAVQRFSEDAIGQQWAQVLVSLGPKPEQRPASPAPAG